MQQGLLLDGRLAGRPISGAMAVAIQGKP